MKVRALAFLLGVFLVFATAAGVLAQSAPAPAAPPDSTTQSDSATKGNADVKAEGKVEKPPAEGPAPKSDQRSDVNVNIDRKSRVEGRDDGGSALPREVARDRSTILGVNPMAAILVAAALLVVVILALVAMTRSSDQDRTYIDTNRRM